MTTATRRSTEPTRAPSPLTVDPIDRYGAQLFQWRDLPREACRPAGNVCFRLDPQVTVGPTPEDTSGCRVVDTRPDLRNGLTIPAADAPLKVTAELDCVNVPSSDT